MTQKNNFLNTNIKLSHCRGSGYGLHSGMTLNFITANDNRVKDPGQKLSGMTPNFDERQTTRGFTLIELLVVVLIIGILAAVAVPQYQKAVLKSRYTEYDTVIHTLAKAIELFYVSTGSYPEYWDQLDVEIPGCTGTGKLGDLVCNNFYIDLNEESLNLRDEPNKPNRTRSPVHISVSYFFLNTNFVLRGYFNCIGNSQLGKEVCKSICGYENCVYQ